MSTIATIPAGLEPLGLPMPQEFAARPQERSGQANDAATGDVVRIDDISIKRRQAEANQDAEPLSFEQALEALGIVQAQNAEDLSQAHGPLDASRVFRLLGLSE